jgi:hypothetical protein
MLAQGFYRLDGMPFSLGGKHHARIDWLAIQQHGAGTTIASFTTMLDAKIAQTAKRNQ